VVKKSRDIHYCPRPDATPEVELNGLVAVYRFLVLEKGDPHDLTNGAATEAEGAKLDKKGKDSDVCC
jgi:hypothetical protein